MLVSIIDTSLIFTSMWKETKLDYNHSVKEFNIGIAGKIILPHINIDKFIYWEIKDSSEYGINGNWLVLKGTRCS